LLLDNDRRRSSVSYGAYGTSLYRGVIGRSAANAGEARAIALAAPRMILRMDVVSLFVALWRANAETRL
jgi:hypothetical protein